MFSCIGFLTYGRRFARFCTESMDQNKLKPSAQLVTQHLSNERTYLAWLRTSMSLLTLGFATSKFGEFLNGLRAKSDLEPAKALLTGSHRFGIGMVILGTLLMAFSSVQYQHSRKAIDAGTYGPSVILIWFITIFAILFGITAVLLVLET